MKRPARHKEAFLESFNTIGLAGAAALSAALLNPVPILAALVAEAAYLLFVPDSKWFERRLSARYDQEVTDRRKRLEEQVFPSLSSDMKVRFSRLSQLREQIGGQQFDGRLVYREVLRKLDYLLEKFLMFASKEVEFENYLRSMREELEPSRTVKPPPLVKGKRVTFDITDLRDRDEWIQECTKAISDKYRDEIENIDKLVLQDGNLHNQALLEKRKEVLHRRSQYVVRIGEILVNLSHQLHLMEDTFGLINDEIRARSPEQVLADVDDVVFQTDNLTETLQDVAPFDLMPLEAGARKLYAAENEK